MADRPDLEAGARAAAWLDWSSTSPETMAQTVLIGAGVPELQAELEQAREALRQADDLLRYLNGWDVMQVTGDGPYWKGEIARVREVLSGSGSSKGRERG